MAQLTKVSPAKYNICFNISFTRLKVSVTRICHNHIQQTNTRNREEESKNDNGNGEHFYLLLWYFVCHIQNTTKVYKNALPSQASSLQNQKGHRYCNTNKNLIPTPTNMRGSRGGTGGLPPPPLKITEIYCFLAILVCIP